MHRNADGPLTSTGAHLLRLDELHIRSADGLTFFVLVVAQERSARFRTSVSRPKIFHCKMEHSGRGPALGGGELGKSVDSSQVRSASRTAIADVRPCLPDQVTPTERNVRCRRVKTRRSALLAVRQEVVQTGQLWHHECRPPPSSTQSYLKVCSLCAASKAFIMPVIEATQVVPPATQLAHSIMSDAYRDMRSRRARCQCCRCKCRRST